MRGSGGRGRSKRGREHSDPTYEPSQLGSLGYLRNIGTQQYELKRVRMDQWLRMVHTTNRMALVTGFSSLCVSALCQSGGPVENVLAPLPEFALGKRTKKRSIEIGGHGAKK